MVAALVHIITFPLHVTFGVARVLFILHKLKKQIDKDADAFFSDKRAAAWRLKGEKFCKALEAGNANWHFLPGWLRAIVEWICPRTKAENYIGRFGQRLLKSGKVERNDPELTKPYRVH